MATNQLEIQVHFNEVLDKLDRELGGELRGALIEDNNLCISFEKAETVSKVLDFFNNLKLPMVLTNSEGDLLDTYNYSNEIHGIRVGAMYAHLFGGTVFVKNVTSKQVSFSNGSIPDMDTGEESTWGINKFKREFEYIAG